MNAETMREMLRRQPFEPFQIRMTNGDIHEIRHPEFGMVTGGRFVIGYEDRVVILSLLHIAAIEMTPAVRV